MSFRACPWASPPAASPQRGVPAGRSTIAHATSGRTSVHPGRPRGGRPLQRRPVDPGGGHDSATEAQQIVRIARAQLGDRWHYGATGPRSFDCSGLVVYAFRKAGDARAIHTGFLRSARSIYHWFKAHGKASRTNPRVGDLVIWGGGTHIGIYIGRGKAISTLAQRRAHPRRPRRDCPVHGLPAHRDVDQTGPLTARRPGPRTARRPDDPARDPTAGVVRYPAPSTSAAQARIAAADRSMSSSVVDQPETDTRIAAWPAHVVPPRKQRAVALDRVDDGACPDVAGLRRARPPLPRTGRGPG